jgi:nitrite reductase/ring-hydroxylating ferredoxin subunit
MWSWATLPSSGSPAVAHAAAAVAVLRDSCSAQARQSPRWLAPAAAWLCQPAGGATLLTAVLALLLLLLSRHCCGCGCLGARPSPQRRYQRGERRRTQLDRLRARGGNFPAPYPNGWYHVCDAEELVGGQVLAITALGREMVGFRGANGVAGVLHAFCPHLGTHLGHGGRVEGDTLVCPYHEWCARRRRRLPTDPPTYLPTYLPTPDIVPMRAIALPLARPLAMPPFVLPAAVSHPSCCGWPGRPVMTLGRWHAWVLR